MANVADAATRTLIPARGVSNLAPETSVPYSTLREAENVDITREGRVRRREGRTRVLAAPACHSLWKPDDYPAAFYVSSGTLYALDSSLQPVSVITGLAPYEPVSYALINDRVYWANGVQSGVVTDGFESYLWAPPEPVGQPALSADAAGGLDAGTYQVAVTFRDALGREGGTGVAAAVDVVFGGGIRLTGIPVPPATSLVTTVRVYRTGANDTSLRHVLDVPAGTTTVLLGASERGRILDTQFLRPLPPGRIVRYGHGRQWVARGNELLWSPSLRYGLHDPATMRLRFPAAIDVLEPLGTADSAGIVVAAGDRTYWLAGADPAQFVQRVLHPHGAVAGSSVANLPGTVFGLESSERGAAWLSRQGFHCLCLPGGQLVRMNEAQAVTDVPERGTSFFREVDGVRQLLTTTRAGAPPSLRVRDRLVATNIGPAP